MRVRLYRALVREENEVQLMHGRGTSVVDQPACFPPPMLLGDSPSLAMKAAMKIIPMIPPCSPALRHSALLKPTAAAVPGIAP